MKQFEIILENGQTYIVEGRIVCPNEETGQSSIWVGDYIVAVIPSSAFIRKI
jgi:hypothetical protein